VATASPAVSAQERAAALNVIHREQRSLWGDAWERLRKNKFAMAGSSSRRASRPRSRR